jgi:hypothetical protein
MRPFGKFSREANVEGFQDVEVPARRSRQLEAVLPPGSATAVVLQGGQKLNAD